MSTASRLTTKYQATVPDNVRRFLKLEAGDRVVWEIEDGVVTIRKATPFDLEYAKALESTLSEWSTKNDEEAYHGL